MRKPLLLTLLVVFALLAPAACRDAAPTEPSDTERLMGEALDAIGARDLPTAERRAYSAAILSADSAEMTDALTLLSLVFMLEDKQAKAQMVMEVLPRDLTAEYVRLQSQASERAASHDRTVFAGFVGALLLAGGGYAGWSRRRKAQFERRVDELVEKLDELRSRQPADTAAASTPATAPAAAPSRLDIARTKQGVDVLYAILHDENISQMGKREQTAVAETLRVADPELAAIVDAVDTPLTPKETFYCIMERYGKSDRQKARSFCCSEQALRSTKSRLGKKLDLNILKNLYQ